MPGQRRLTIVHLLPPLLAAAAVLLSSVVEVPPGLLWLPLTLAVLFSALALRLNQVLVFCTGLTPAVALLLVRFDLWPEVSATWLLLVTLPIWLITFYAAGNTPLLTAGGILRLLVLPTAPAVLALVHGHPVLGRVLTIPLFAFPAPWNIPLVGLFLVVLLLALITMRPGQTSYYEYALAWAFVPVYWSAGMIDGLEVISFQVIASYLILLHAVQRLYWLRVYRDDLTGVLNRRALEERLPHMRGDYTLAMVDVDHFKTFNDTFGHAEGDHVLRFVAQHLGDRSGGTVYRYGGEEFAVAYPRGRTDHAATGMETARSELAAETFRIRKPERVGRNRRGTGGELQLVQITISVGIARSAGRRGGRLSRARQTLDSADQALYTAKGTGRNKVVIDGQPVPVPEETDVAPPSH